MMILLDAPYVSDFLKQSVADLGLSVLDTETARAMTAGADVSFIDTVDFTARLGKGERVLANSENALMHIFGCGCNEELTRMIDVCKDKALYREALADLHPDYRFLRAAPDALAAMDTAAIPFPCIVKPARGFFSLGVHAVSGPEEWDAVAKAVSDEREAMNKNYPETVVDAGAYIIEETIEGEEYAIDAYFTADGEPVITNILHHRFISAEDLSDRFYYTSTAIMEQWLAPFTDYVGKVGRACGLRNFPMHLEVRVDEAGNINSIEANPLRFAGWCVADITRHAWGFSPYEYFFKDKRPDWPALMEAERGTACIMVIGDLPPGVDGADVAEVDHAGFEEGLGLVLEHRVIDHTAYPVFAFVFARIDEKEVEPVLDSLRGDFSRYLTMK